jgi:NAD(P)-dependent dehydrogenase (short-subunit alcohol dehydrogenase family)
LDLLLKKVALITGAARGIGKEIALVFIENGARVVLADISSEIQPLAAALNQSGEKKAAAVWLDVTNPTAVQAAVDTAVQEFGQLDILVNNAAILRPANFIDLSLADWELVYKVNVTGAFLCAQAAARQMIKQNRGGCIINISSASAKKADPQGAAYNSSKSALIGLTRIMALELGRYQIRANAILPGATDTEMLRDLLSKVPGLKKMLEERTPLQKMATPRDQANAALFLASDLASHVTGEQLVVSGGEFMET